MEILTYGKPASPAILLLPDDGMAADVLPTALKPLEKSFYLLCPVFAAGEDAVSALEARLDKEFTGRIWGAYGLRRGADTLLELLSRKKLRIRTAVVEGASALPAAPLAGIPGRLYYWYRSCDRKAKKLLKALRAELPAVRTLALKKLKTGQEFYDIRSDLMVKKLEASFGKAQTVVSSTVINAARPQLWGQLFARPETGAISRGLRDGLPLERDDAAYTQIVEGRTDKLTHWSHLTRLKSLGGSSTEYIDQVEVSAGRFTPLAARFAEVYLRRQQKKRAKILKKINK